MASDIHDSAPGAPISRPARKIAAARFGLAAARANLAASRQFTSRRRRDLRFRILPYAWPEIANAAALALTACVLLVVLLDPYLTLWQDTLPTPLVAVFKVLTDLGQSDWILVGSGLFVILSLLADASALRARLRVRRAVRSLTALYIFVAVAISGLIAVAAKYVIGRARPKHFPDSGSFAFDFWSGDASWAGFPSGHATTAMALGVALALLFPRLRWLFLCAGFWIAASRLFTGSHYPSDVLAGGLLGAVTAWLFARALAQHRLVFGFGADGSLVRRTGASGRLR